MRFWLDEGAKPPVRAHVTDAGVDLCALNGGTIPACGVAVFHTGVHVELHRRTVGLVKSKSGLNVRHGITATGVVDEGYTGEITVSLHNDSRVPYAVAAGDRIAQLVVTLCDESPVEIVDSCPKDYGGSRGDTGFGASGK